MQCAKMQSSTNPATFLDLSTAHLTNSLQLNASASGIPACIPLTSGDSTIGAGSGQDERRNRFSWIRRLKPRDGLDLSNGGVAEGPSRGLNSEKGDSAERRPNWKIESVADAKRRKTSEQNVAEGPRMDVHINESGKSVALPATAPLSAVGFGPWVNLSSCRKPDMRSDSGLGSSNIVGAVTSAHELSKDVQRGFRAPPLLPIQGKVGLPPRPPSQKAAGFQSPSKLVPIASGMGRGVFYQPDRQLSDAPLHREGALERQLVGVQDKETHKFPEAASARSGSSFQNLNTYRVKQSRPSVVERSAMGHQLGNCLDAAAVQVEHGRRGVGGDLHAKIFREGVKEPICTDLPSDSPRLALQLEVSGPGTEAALKKGSLLQQTVSTEPKRVASQQSPSGSTDASEKAAAIASASASLPWEMFVEPAGAAKKAREQFVEVYNRARDELKNQRMSQRTSATTEMDGGPKLTLGPSDAVSDHRVERQLMKHEQHSAGHLQAQGRLKILSQTSELNSLSLASNLKEQQALSLTESKDPGSILANEQSGSNRDTAILVNSGTPFKQLEGFSREQTLSEGLVGSSLRTLVREGDQNATGERLDERSVVGSRPREDSQNFSSNSSANPKELISKLNEDRKCNGSGQIVRVSHQRDGDTMEGPGKQPGRAQAKGHLDKGWDGQESIAAVGKRSRATFEDHAISKVPEKVAGSRGRPDIWLQRWHPTAVQNSIGLPDSQVQSDGKRNDSVKYLALGLKRFKDGDGVGALSRAREVNDVAVDKEKGVKSFKSSSLKTLPSAAAMAIVGTAARQFCSVHPQRKGSFAFWSGFGMPTPRKLEPIQEKGNGKMFVKADANWPNC